MPTDLHEVIHYFETNENRVSTKDLREILKFTPDKIDKFVLRGDLQRIEHGTYALTPQFYKKCQVVFPEGTLRLDRNSYDFSANIPKTQAETLVKSVPQQNLWVHGGSLRFPS